MSKKKKEKVKFNYKEKLMIIILSVFVVYMTIVFQPTKRVIHSYYQVYLGGEKSGLIADKDELYDLIDHEQQEIKDKYNVDKVYSPFGLEVMNVATYSNNLKSAKDVYDEIKDLDPFTIEAYEVTIKNKKNNKVFYILNKDDLDKAIRKTILAFVKEDTYEKYLAGEQEEVVDTGIEITNIYLKDNVSIKKTYVSTDEKIFTDVDDLSMYFLFGSTNLKNTYKVKSNDTIKTIAYKNKLGVSDFLIANPNIAGENALLAVGQEVTVDPVSPLSDVVVEMFETKYQTIRYDTKVIYDKNLRSDQTYVKQAGSNGLYKVTYATKKVNNYIANAGEVKTEVIKEPVDRVVVYGALNVVYYGNTTFWAWPTINKFYISSYYGYRICPYHGRELHSGVDIITSGNKDVYAIQDGTVTSAKRSGDAGLNIVIKHANGYSSQYMHLSKFLVKVGEKVEKGQKIGIQGKTGTAQVVHLHFTVRHNGKLMNPLDLYK